MDNFEGEIPEIQDFLYRHRVTSHGRRRTVHVTERSQTAIGLLRTTESPVIKPLTTKHVSLTPSPTRKDHVQFEHIGYSALPNRRYSSYVASSRTVTSHHLIKKCKSDLLTNRHRVHTHHILTPFSQRNGHFAYARQKSRVFSVQEEDVVRKDTDDTEDDAPIPEASLVRFNFYESLEKQLLAKFKLAVNLTIFCSRQFKKHCLRLNEHNDELSPYIKRLHFHEDDHHSTDDLLIDLSKFKANRQMRVPEETKRILSKEVSERTEHEVYTVTLALRNIKSFSEYPKRMQKKIAEVGLYEKYESKRMIIRQGHPASAFYFILSGAVVIMVMDEDSKYARPVAHLYKGQTFGELAIINETKRNSTVIAKETCEFMSISVRGYHKIFMAGGVKNISDPDQEIFLKSLTCLAAWPIQILQQNPNKCQFLFFKNGEVIVRDSHYSDWLIIVKSGSIEVLKKLKRVQAFEWKRKKATEIVQGSKKREIIIKRIQWRRVLPEISIPLNPDEDFENVELLNNGHPMPFVHPDDDNDIAPKEKHVKKQPQIPNLWPFKVDLSEIESGRYLDDNRGTGQTPRIQTIPENINVDGKWQGKQLNRLNSKELLGIKQRGRSNSMVQEEEKELLGYQPHIRTIMEDIDGGMKRRDSEDINPADINPEFVHVQTLTKGQVFGLADLIITDQPNFSVVSRGADCLLINKQFYIDNASERLLLDVRHELCPYPTEEELQERLQVSVDWQAYKKSMLLESLENVSSRRVIRTTLNGTKA